jgi:NAD(P)-dependent dehydrogenase (short-subunit alcohol dehydrogenase family)
MQPHPTRQLDAAAEAAGMRLRVLPRGVLDAGTVQAAVAQAMADHSRIGALVNNTSAASCATSSRRARTTSAR